MKSLSQKMDGVFSKQTEINLVEEKAMNDKGSDLSNSGSCNSGSWNSGNRNSGAGNSGDMNSGSCNSGDMNSGAGNSGDMNSGAGNSGNRNSGAGNSGNRNSGNRNSGSWNSGDSNSGNRNSGSWNSGDSNSGFFNTNTPAIRMFNKEIPTVISFNEIELPEFLYFDLTEWIPSGKGTPEEEEKNRQEIETCGGFLRELEFKEAFQRAYAQASEEEKTQLKSLPNFDADIFFEISGIKV